ncbi:glutaredoxin-related protein 5, mitochondrial [Trichonephila inaurata madagascariensis]|uniref:Glutaredoxin-related protein 5, mitochondrial n=1 Tax=Trichonephila inaurata madagascariensis TaxID=2747483 RepID=A0A8X6YTY7_9ARAC|nr:glutaredoxin-related protein 5, mitochondrial [Trichonephila inaurata madagascariensis]
MALKMLFASRNNAAKSLSLITNRFFCSPMNDKLSDLVKKSKVVVFMKGVPEQPRCGFSNAVVQILNMHGVKYDSYNVLDDEQLRQGMFLLFLSYLRLCIKEFSNWPTIPQVFINGEFVGGCDILLQMHQNGELVEELKKVNITSALLTNEKPK